LGRYLPSSVVVALGEPGVPVICWANAVVARVNSEHVASRVAECSLDEDIEFGLPVLFIHLLHFLGNRA
jgi:hypothetical protein